jgi:hypothetical protein
VSIASSPCSLLTLSASRALIDDEGPRCAPPVRRIRLRCSVMDRHSQIVSEETSASRVSGKCVVQEVIRLQLTLIAALAGADLRLRQFIDLARAAHAGGSEDEMVKARVAMWGEIQRIEENSVSITYRESALLRSLLPFPEPDDTNDDGLAWTSEMIQAASKLPSYVGDGHDC